MTATGFDVVTVRLCVCCTERIPASRWSSTFTAFLIIDAEDLKALRFLPEDTGLPWSVFLGAAGMPEQTAYYGYKELEPKLVTRPSPSRLPRVRWRLAKKSKLVFVRELVADVVFNYKTTSVDVLKEHYPVDIY